MAAGEPTEVSLNTVHEDLTRGFADLKGEIGDLKGGVRAGFTDLKGELTDLKGEMRAGFAELKVTLIAGFQGLPTRESSEEVVRLLREGNRLHEERFTQLELRLREQHSEIQQILRAVAEGARALLEGQRALSEEIRSLSADIKALIARLDALIQGRGDGFPRA